MPRYKSQALSLKNFESPFLHLHVLVLVLVQRYVRFEEPWLTSRIHVQCYVRCPRWEVLASDCSQRQGPQLLHLPRSPRSRNQAQTLSQQFPLPKPHQSPPQPNPQSQDAYLSLSQSITTPLIPTPLTTPTLITTPTPMTRNKRPHSTPLKPPILALKLLSRQPILRAACQNIPQHL